MDQINSILGSLDKIPAFLFGLGVLFISFEGAAQSFERLDWPVIENNTPLSMPFTGGFHNPQFSNMDLDGDGTEDLLIFDRDGDIIIPVLVDNGGEEPDYEFAPRYKERFPELENWVLIRDYNNDDIPDIFTAPSIQGLQGISVYRGKQTQDGLDFELVTFPDQPYPSMLYFNFQGNEVQIYVNRIDVPSFADVNGDGDLDILTFDQGNGVYLLYYENQSVEMGYGADSLIYDRVDECWGKFAESIFNDAVVLSDNPSQCAQDGVQGGGGSSRHSGSTVLPVDIDQDGSLDLLIGDNGSDDVVYMRNGQSSEEAFMVEKDKTYPSNNTPAQFSSFLGAFHLDTDGNGSEELLFAPNSISTGINSDQIWKYQRGGETGGNAFQLVQKDFLLDQTIDLSGASKPTWVDVDGDSRLDLIVGVHGFIDEENIDPRLFYYRQTGTLSNPEFELVDDNYLEFSALFSDPSSEDSKFAFDPVFADMDGDGDQDLICGEYWGSLIYGENTAGPGQPIAIDELQLNWMDIDVGQASSPMVYDFNGDGLKDLVVGERIGNNQNGMACGNVNYFQNQGSEEEPFFDDSVSLAPNSPCFGDILTQSPGVFSGYSAPALLPIEGNAELLVGARSGEIRRYAFGSSPGVPFELIDSYWGDLRPGERSDVAVADVDEDGVFEMIAGNNRGGLELVQSNLQTDGGIVSTASPGQPSTATIYPNPTDGRLTIQLTGKMTDQREISVLSTDGREVMSKQMPAGHKTVSMDLSPCEPGIYFIRITAPNRITVTKKVLHF